LTGMCTTATEPRTFSGDAPTCCSRVSPIRPLSGDRRAQRCRCRERSPLHDQRARAEWRNWPATCETWLRRSRRRSVQYSRTAMTPRPWPNASSPRSRHSTGKGPHGRSRPTRSSPRDGRTRRVLLDAVSGKGLRQPLAQAQTQTSTSRTAAGSRRGGRRVELDAAGSFRLTRTWPRVSLAVRLCGHRRGYQLIAH
jgi:hypothetical protein